MAMYQNLLAALDLNEEASCRAPLLAGAEMARRFSARLHLLTVIRDVEAIWQLKAAPLGYDVVVAYLENRLGELIRRHGLVDLEPDILVRHGASIYDEILSAVEETGADLVVIGSHRPAMKDYLLGTNASRVVRHARCSVLVARE
jgi:nucleotide-binding universal stress UspA family protein